METAVKANPPSVMTKIFAPEFLVAILQRHSHACAAMCMCKNGR
jgi:uncharacterized membrane protein